MRTDHFARGFEIRPDRRMDTSNADGDGNRREPPENPLYECVTPQPRRIVPGAVQSVRELADRDDADQMLLLVDLRKRRSPRSASINTEVSIRTATCSREARRSCVSLPDLGQSPRRPEEGRARTPSRPRRRALAAAR